MILFLVHGNHIGTGSRDIQVKSLKDRCKDINSKTLHVIQGIIARQIKNFISNLNSIMTITRCFWIKQNIPNSIT